MLNKELWDKCVAFHGHECPGLSIGYRAALYAAKLLDLLETAPIKYRALVTLDMYSGLRRAELLGLEWRDIDMEHEVISVRRTSNHTVREGNYTDTTKSEKSARSLKLPPVVFDVLKELKAYNEEQREQLGTKWVESDRLFTKWNGEPMGINTPYEWLKNFCKENDMPFCGVHGLRHQYVKYTTKKFMDFSEKFSETPRAFCVRPRKVRTSRTFSPNVAIATKKSSV